MLICQKVPCQISLFCYQFRKTVSVHSCRSTNLWKGTKMEEPRSRLNPVILKIDTPQFHSIFSPELNTLVGIFDKYNHELRIAGGAVRDILMDIKPKDLDFATTATPHEMKEMFTQEDLRMINTKGEKHGTITTRINDKENFEITTLRIDVLTNGRHAQVEFTKDWKQDSNRRDLTINSMFLGLDGTVYDYFYGYEDLKKRRVLFVGDAGTRIREDYLRILRYFRFYGRIAPVRDNHDAATLEAIHQNKDGLEQIAGERIWSEWHKIIIGNHSVDLMKKMIELGISTHMGLPDHPDTEEFERVAERALANKISLHPIALISALLRDQQEVMNLHARLKLSARDRDLALFIVQHREDKPCKQPLKPYQHLVLIPKARVQDLKEFVAEVLKYRGAINLLDEFNSWQPPKFPVNGTMLTDYVTNRKMMGVVMTKLKEHWLDTDFKLTSGDLLKCVPKIIEEISARET